MVLAGPGASSLDGLAARGSVRSPLYDVFLLHCWPYFGLSLVVSVVVASRPRFFDNSLSYNFPLL